MLCRLDVNAQSPPGAACVLGRFVAGCALAALFCGALYGLLLSAAANFPRPLPDQLVLALWFGVFLSAPNLTWALLRVGLRLAIRRADPLPGWNEVLGEGCVVAAITIGASILLFDLAVGQSLFSIERARSGLRWFFEDLALLVGLAGVTAWVASRALRGAERTALRAFGFGLGGLLLLNGVAGGVSLAARPPSHRLRPGTPVERASNPVRVILIGLDGVSWNILDPMLATGQMPALKEAISKGVRAELESEPRAQSPVAWSTLLTGRPPSEHGVIGYVVTDFPGASVQVETTLGKSGRWLYPFYAMAAVFQLCRLGDAVPPTSAYRRADSLWDLVSAMGGSANAINCWATWPAYPIHGAIVSDAFFGDWMWVKSRRQVDEHAVSPPELASELAKWTTPPESFDVSFFRGWADFDERDWVALRTSLRSPEGLGQPLTHLKWSAAIQENAFRVAGELLRTRPADLTVVESAMPDDINHFFARFRFPNGLTTVSPEDARKLGPILDASYHRLDELLAPLLKLADERTAVVIVSDHGFLVLDDSPISDLAHDPMGVLIAVGGPFDTVAPTRRASLYDVTPTVLHLLGYPIPKDLRGRVLVDLFQREFAAAHPPRTQ